MKQVLSKYSRRLLEWREANLGGAESAELVEIFIKDRVGALSAEGS